MNKQKFKVGDRVRIVREWPKDELFAGKMYDGKTGTLVRIILGVDKFHYGVRLDNGHYLTANEIELVKPKHPVIVITTDGKTTTATVREGKKVLKTATATCSDKDTFSFDEGARIAFERLQGRCPFKKDPFYTGKVVCIRCTVPHFWTVGKVYEIKDGIVKDDFGTTLKYIRNVDELNCKLAKFLQFIPLVEG